MSNSGSGEYVRHADRDAVWKPIAGFSGYEISSDGRVLSFRQKRERLLRPGMLQNGYLHVCLMSDDGSRLDCLVHQLVAEAFLPRPEAATVVMHRDDNKQHNAVSNLAWATHGINMAHASARGRMTRKTSKKTKAGAKALDAFIRSAW